LGFELSFRFKIQNSKLEICSYLAELEFLEEFVKMARVKRGNVARKRRKKILKLAKGFRGSHSRLFRTANQQVMKALRNAYRDRRKRKRDFRRLWITRINAAARQHGISYSQLMGGLKKANIQINRKMLSQMAVLDPAGFEKVLELVSHSVQKKSA
jgi:large subunit ribosomal protein L20